MLQGVLNAYYSSLKKVELHGPTHFAPILEYVSGFTAASNTVESGQPI